MMRGPTPQPGGGPERKVLGVLLLLAGVALVALGSWWGWLGVAAGIFLIVTAEKVVEDATESPTTRRVPAEATPIEPDQGAALGNLVPLAIAALVVWFKFGAIALFVLRLALQSTDYSAVEVRDPAPPPLVRGDVVLVRRGSPVPHREGMLVLQGHDGRFLRVTVAGSDTVPGRDVAVIGRAVAIVAPPQRWRTLP